MYNFFSQHRDRLFSIHRRKILC